MKLNTVEELIADLRQGKMIVLMDDEDRENEGDLIIAAEAVRTEDINFMATHARGLICLTLTKERCEFLKLPLMVDQNATIFSTNFTVSIEAAEGVTTGISAADRARTVRAAVDENSSPDDIVQPGHIFPLMAQPGGVLRRAGHTEAGCDLARLAGFSPAAVIVEIMNADGSMARRDDLENFAQQHKLKIGTIVDLIHYRMANENTIERSKSYQLPTEHGEFTVFTYSDSILNTTHMALVKGEIKTDEPTLVRVHVASTTRDVLDGVNATRRSWSLRKSLAKVAEEGKGVVVLLAEENGNKDLGKNIEAFLGLSSIKKPDHKDRSGNDLTIGTGSQILRDLGVGKMRLLSFPTKFNAITGFDLEVVEFIQCE